MWGASVLGLHFKGVSVPRKGQGPLAMVTLVMFLRRRRRTDPAPVLQGTGGTPAVLPCAVGNFLSFTSAADPKCMLLPFLCPENWRGQESTASGSMAQITLR